MTQVAINSKNELEQFLINTATMNHLDILRLPPTNQTFQYFLQYLQQNLSATKVESLFTAKPRKKPSIYS